MKWNKALLVQPTSEPSNQSGLRVVNLFSGGQIDKTCFNAQRSDLTQLCENKGLISHGLFPQMNPSFWHLL